MNQSRMTPDDLFNLIREELDHGGITGWCPIEKALDLAAAVITLRPEIVLETGVWGGRSLLPMALACEAVNNGVVIGIDPWSPNASTEGYAGVNAEWWKNQDHERVYSGFMEHVTRLQLKNRVAIERAKSDDAAVPTQIDLLHLDSQHTDMAVREVKKFAVNVRVGGIVCLDDIEWQNDGDKPVARAIDELLNMGFIELYRRIQTNGNWGMFQRISLPAPSPTAAKRPAEGKALSAPKRRANR